MTPTTAKRFSDCLGSCTAECGECGGSAVEVIYFLRDQLDELFKTVESQRLERSEAEGRVAAIQGDLEKTNRWWMIASESARTGVDTAIRLHAMTAERDAAILAKQNVERQLARLMLDAERAPDAEDDNTAAVDRLEQQRDDLVRQVASTIHASDSALEDAARLRTELERMTIERNGAAAEVMRLRSGHVPSVVFGHHPDAPRPFALRHPGRRELSYLGVQWPDGYVVVRPGPDGDFMPWRGGVDAMLADFAASAYTLELVWLLDETLEEQAGALADVERMEQAVVAQAGAFAEVMNERDRWRKKAKKAEKKLADMATDPGAISE